MAKTKNIRVTEEELLALQALRETKISGADGTATTVSDAQQALADAFVTAIERTREKPKAQAGSRKKKTPWSPKDGEPKLKMKRVFFQHGIPLGENVDNETIALLHQLKPGHYCDGYVRVTLRKDRGIDISYPVRTASQRLRMVNQYGIRSFPELLQRLIDEKNDPKKYRKPEDEDLFDLEN
jgi:hypothetical protein